MSFKNIKISLDQEDSQILKHIAKFFNIKELDVLRKGLKFMLLVSQLHEGHSLAVIDENDQPIKKIII